MILEDYNRLGNYIFEQLLTYEETVFPLVSPRVAGDSVQQWVSDILKEYFRKKDVEFTPSEKLGRVSMADCIVKVNGETHYVDIKTHCKSGTFSAPNLVSIKRLYKFLTANQNNYFDILVVDYTIAGNQIHFDNVHFVPIDSINWDCLRIGNLGNGQIQLKDASVIIAQQIKRSDWLTTMQANIAAFYIKQQNKIRKEFKFYGLD